MIRNKLEFKFEIVEYFLENFLIMLFVSYYVVCGATLTHKIPITKIEKKFEVHKKVIIIINLNIQFFATSNNSNESCEHHLLNLKKIYLNYEIIAVLVYIFGIVHCTQCTA